MNPCKLEKEAQAGWGEAAGYSKLHSESRTKSPIGLAPSLNPGLIAQ